MGTELSCLQSISPAPLWFCSLLVCLLLVLFYEVELYQVGQVGLKLTGQMKTMLSPDLQNFACFCLQRVGVSALSYYTHPLFFSHGAW